jgi:hypothetical protein
MKIGKCHLQGSKTDFWKLVEYIQFQHSCDEVQVLPNSPAVSCTIKTTMKISLNGSFPKL